MNRIKDGAEGFEISNLKSQICFSVIILPILSIHVK